MNKKTMLKTLLLLLTACFGFTGLSAQLGTTVSVTSPANCFASTFVFSYDAANSPDATGRFVYYYDGSKLEIRFNNSASPKRWEIRARGGNNDVYYVNFNEFSSNPPDSGASTWEDFGFCDNTGAATVSGTGTQSAPGGDPCDGLGGDSDGDGACDDNELCPGSDDFADQDSDGIPDGCDDNPTVPDGVLVDATCLDSDPILFTLSGTDGTGRNIYSTTFANGLEVRYNSGQGRWEVRASSGSMSVYLYSTNALNASWPDPPNYATWTGTGNLCTGTFSSGIVTGSGTQSTLGCIISIGTPTVTQPTCGGDGVIAVTAGGARGSITYSLKKGSTTVSSNGTGTFNGLDAGTYTVLASDGAFPTGVCEVETGSILLVVQDDVDPLITCPSNITVSNDAGKCSAVVNYTPPVGVDNCPSPSTMQTAGLGTGADFPVGVTVETYRVTDGAGNTASCSFNVTVNDTEAPEITCPADITVANDPGECSAVVTYIPTVGTDNCPGTATTQTDGLGTGATFPVGVTTETYLVTDASGNVDDCSFTVTVNDTEKPNAVCQDITVNLGTFGFYTLDPGELDGGSTDNCAISGFGITTTVFDCNDVGLTFPIELSVSDKSSNFAVCTARVTVGDEDSPDLLTCPGNIVVDNDPGLCGATVNYALPTFSDNCTVTGFLGNGWDTGDFFPVGTTTVQYTGFDAANNPSELCSFTVTVNDEEAPTLTCISEYAVSLDTDGEVAILEGQSDPVRFIIDNFFTTYSDNCGLNFVSYPALRYNCNTLGENTARFFADDENGLKSFCDVKIIVNDQGNNCNQAPEAICQTGDVGVRVDENCVAFLSPAQIDNGSFDPDGDPLTLSLDNNGPFAPGTYTVELSASDGLLEDQCTARVVVLDDTPPTAICPPDIMVQCAGLVPLPDANLVGFEDNCGLPFTASHVRDQTDFEFNPEVQSRYYQVTDQYGNESECIQKITIQDTTDPEIIGCPASGTINVDASCQGEVLDYTSSLSVQDNCGTDQFLTLSQSPIAGTLVSTDFELIVTAWDRSGNTSQCRIPISIVDPIVPSITCPTNISVANDAGDCGAIVYYQAPVGTDNCSGAFTSRTAGLGSGARFPVGTTTETYQVTDAQGNSKACSFTVTVNDVEAPTISCPADIMVVNDFGQTTAVVNYLVTGGDNCPGAVLDPTSGLGSGASFPVGTTTESYLLTDAAGNTDDCSFTVTVENRPVNITYTGDVDEQYSDQADLSATLVDGLNGQPIPGQTLVFTLGGESLSATTNSSGEASTTLIIDKAPGDYEVTVSYAGNSQYKNGQTTADFEVLQENALATYTGTTYASTGSSRSSVATVLLSATIQDISDNFRGDIRNATVTFVNRDGGGALSPPLSVSLINASNTTIGTVAYEWTVDIGSKDAEQFEIGIIVDNYYTANDPSEDVVVTVAKALSERFVSGGGYLVLCCSEGAYEGQSGTKNNFGFNIKFNKKGTNLQGNIRALFRHKVGGALRTYQIKGNQMQSLSVQDGYAEFSGKANINDVTDPNNTFSVEGNGSFLVKMTDNGEPGSSDNISFTLYDKGGALWFTSNWSGTVPVLQTLDGGNLKVHDGKGAGSKGKGYTITVPEISGNTISGTSQPATQDLSLEAFPNPFRNEQTVRFQLVETGWTNLQVFNLQGQLVRELYRGELDAGEHQFQWNSIEGGDVLPSGVYLLRLQSGTDVVVKKVSLLRK